jgi:uncharacterized membrane protein
MTSKRPEDVSRSAHRRILTISLLRAGASAAALVVVYYVAPLDRSPDAATWIGFVGGLATFAAMIVWQVRAITESDTPRLRAIQAVAIGLPTLLLVFAATYVVIANGDPDSFNEPLGRTDALYFTVTVFATVGFGDIVPRTEAARILTMIQMIMGLVAVGLVAKLVLGAVDVAVRRRAGGNPESARRDDRPQDLSP